MAFAFLGTGASDDKNMDGFLEWEVNLTDRVTQPNGKITESKTPLPFHQCNEDDKQAYLYKFKESQKAVE